MSWRFDIDLDKGKKVYKNADIQSLWAINGMFSIKRYIFNPLGFVNDGFFEVQFREGAQTLQAAAHLLDESEKAVHCYDILKTYRVKEVRLINQNKDSQGNIVSHHTNVDGEIPIFKNYAKIECLKHELDIIVSTDTIFERGYTHNRIGFNMTLEEQQQEQGPSKAPWLLGGLAAAGAAYYYLQQ